MIILEKGQSLLNNTSFVVYNSGNYNEDDLVEVCHINNTELPIASYQAFFIQNGYDYISGERENKKYKIGYLDPIFIDYDILGFHKKRTILFGELIKVEYYEIYDGQNYSNLILDETRNYTRNDDGLVLFRNQTTTWYLEDSSVGLVKNTIKYYTLEESIQEGIERRTNIISKAKSYVLVNIGQLYSFDLLSSVKNEIQLFIEGYTQPLRDSITNSTKPYLNDLLKNSIIDCLRLN